ncbi:Gfo/Idh/MocA family protein [Aestuariivivens sediminis]|uniref:Gfo/Idh/MocA family protein n=1 Tax=Aestuariivivens sediminis TaxID=2913557 RepID=UPI001F5690F3|nr:Gfo/Idh/MocA family oxidoreductase [Aestuariivivens sediminis]
MNRRKFIKQGSAASALILTGTSALADMALRRDRKDIHIGIIGTGQRGSGLIPFINSIENLKVYACCDTIPFRLQEGLKRTNGKAKGYANYKNLLANRSIDAVLIATPFSMHAQIALDAIDAGKHVYCEKTLAKGYQDIQQLIAKVKNANIIFQTGHQYHSSRLYQHVVKLIEGGKVGQITAFECQWNRHGDWRRPVPDPSLERAINWRMYREYSGGLLAELCSHQIDFVNTILKANPIQVMGTGGVDYWKDGRETYDNIHVLYSYPNGVTAKFTCLTNNKKDGYQIKVIGDKGTLIITTDSATFYSEEKKETKQPLYGDVDGVSGATAPGRSWDYGEPIEITHEDPSKQALMDFRDSIVYGKEPISNVVTGAKAAICVQMGLDAMYNNEIVPWNPEHRF